jgi:hypothetical protein
MCPTTAAFRIDTVCPGCPVSSWARTCHPPRPPAGAGKDPPRTCTGHIWPQDTWGCPQNADIALPRLQLPGYTQVVAHSTPEAKVALMNNEWRGESARKTTAGAFVLDLLFGNERMGERAPILRAYDCMQDARACLRAVAQCTTCVGALIQMLNRPGNVKHSPVHSVLTKQASADMSDDGICLHIWDRYQWVLPWAHSQEVPAALMPDSRVSCPVKI